jgi:hypothetical protein
VLVLLMAASMLGGVVVATVPGAEAPASGAIPVLDIAKFALDSMSASANSYECSQTPNTAKCQMGGLGDILRFFGTVEQRQQVQILQMLADIKAKLESISKDMATIREAVNQVQLNTLLAELQPEKVLNMFRIFTQVSQNCLGKTPPYAPNTDCDAYLSGDKPSATKLANDIHVLVTQTIGGLGQVLQAVRGRPGREGLLEVLPKVVTDLTDKTHFFTSSQSQITMDWVQYFVWTELAFGILWQNDEEINHMDPAQLASDIRDYQAVIVKQVDQFKPLPPGTVVDMTSGLMWSTANACQIGGMTGPTCGIASIAGFPLVTSCQRVPNCTLSSPYFGTNVNGVVDDGITAVANTAPNSSWKIPSEPQVTALIQKRPNSNSKAWLQQQAGITFTGDWIWTSTMWCTSWATGKTGATKMCRSGPDRVAYDLSSSTKTVRSPTACNGRPCTAALIFERGLSEAEYKSYGIDKRW